MCVNLMAPATNVLPGSLPKLYPLEVEIEKEQLDPHA
jgi:hypothetical protein